VNRAQASRDVQVARVRLALLPDLPVQTATAGQTNLSQQHQQTQQATPSQMTQPVGAPGQSTPSAAGTSPTGQPGINP